ncbi:MAG: hypothetical protein AABZ55_09050, partial [Bdellovibrionota bacterium]
ENAGDSEAIAKFREEARATPTFSCRERDHRNVEQLSWCDGSACFGATATLKNGICTVTDLWTGQDDGDAVDEDVHAKSCLVRSDF